MILKKVEGRRNPRAWHGSRLTVSGLHSHPSTPNPRPKRRVGTPGDPWGVPQPPGPSSPAYGTPPTANRWFLPLSSSQWGQTLPTTSVMFPVRIEPRGHAQGGKKIPGIWKTGNIPKSWKEATVDHTDPTYYRPIALTSCICKTMERMINDRLTWLLEANNIITDYQSGFRRHRSTNDHLVRLETFIREAFIKKEHLVTIFFDLEKA